jgi:hypothetical protein
LHQKSRAQKAAVRKQIVSTLVKSAQRMMIVKVQAGADINIAAIKAKSAKAQARLLLVSTRQVRQLSIGGTRIAARLANSAP